MIIINEKKIIKNSEQRKMLAYLKDRSKNNYYVFNAWVPNRMYKSSVFMTYYFKIDNIIYHKTFISGKRTSHLYYNINKVEGYIRYAIELAREEVS